MKQGYTHEITLKAAIDKFIDHYKLRYKFDEYQITENWKELAGASIYKHTTDLYIKNNQLHIEVNSSVAKQELMFMRSRLKELINRKMGKSAITEIIIH
jgi:hypothetical protein